MNYFFHLTLDGDSYRVHMRGANIVEISCNNQPVLYDDLSLHVREAILIEALSQLSKIQSQF